MQSIRRLRQEWPPSNAPQSRYERTPLVAESAETIVQAQDDAYNLHDIDAFAATYTEDAYYTRFDTGEVFITGREDIRKSFGGLFAANPNIHVEITNRITLGRFV